MLQDYSNNVRHVYAAKNSFLLMIPVVIFGLFASCSENRDLRNPFDSSAQAPMVMVIKNQPSEFSTGVSNQVAKSLEYAQIPFLTIDLGILNRDFSIPKSVRTLVITTDRISEFSQENVEDLVAYVARGNTIVFTGHVSNPNFAFLQGLKPDTEFNIDSTSVGFTLLADAFPGMNGTTYNPTGLLPHYGLTAEEFADDTKLLAGTATKPEQPFIISNKIGLGEALIINSFVLDQKIYRGIVFSTILRGLQGIPYRVANVSTIFLDDFPAPLYNEKLPPIDEEYDVTHAEFVSKIWWPDMKALADSFNINYSAMTAFNYNANVVPPFDFQEWRQGSILYNQNIVQGSIFLAEDIRDTRHELAFHGYNHFSLWKEDWDNLNFMVSSLQAARKRWQVDNLGPMPTIYVPPTNQIDSLGLEAIVRGMPSIKYMSSLYFGDIEDGGGREFDPDPYVPAQLFNYPRISSGYTMNSNSLLDQQGMQLLTGIWTHFVHPDDVFQVTQRDEDDFKSRNPLGLGWKTDPEYGYGLYHLLRIRIQFTLNNYPNTRFVTATKAGKRTEDWRRSLTNYQANSASMLVRSGYRSNYVQQASESTKHWFMYATESQVSEVNSVLKMQEIEFSRTRIWDGYLYQFKTNQELFFVPNFDKSLYYDQFFVEQLVQDQVGNYQQHLLRMNWIASASGTEEQWQDTRMEDAVRAWRRNPQSRASQENLISLSVEFGQVSRAITVLENRLLESENWDQKDLDRLITYYGWEGMQTRAELFLERLWEKYQSAQVIALKNQAVTALGLFGVDFERRWQLRELQLAPGDYETLLNYTKSIESQENWPEMKENLRKLLEMHPQTDSLYAFTLQRSFYYDSADSTIALVEEFPVSAYPQLMPFASNLALIYAYNAGNYQQALFWANNAPNFDEQQKLYWLGQLNLDAFYKAKALELVTNSPDNDSLRSFVGTNLFYQGFTEDAYRVLYPLFVAGDEQGFTADTLVRNEIGYMTYNGKKQFYNQYPLFFDVDQQEQLQRAYRKTEGIRGSVFGEYRDDNFNNTFARGGVSVQVGNRQNNTHTVKTEYLVFADDDAQTDITLQYQGAGYEFAHRSENQQLEFRAGPTVLFGEGDFIPEGLLSIGYSVDSTYTSAQLTGGAELTSTSLQNNYFQTQLQLYRQNFWFNGNLTTAFSATGKYYTNNVFSYGAQGRVFLDLMDSKWKVRPLAELGYSDATESYLSGIPYYTPDQYFSQGAGLDFQYRNSNTFEYQTQLTGEVMGKHERREGLFFSGRVQFEHKFKNFWEISVGTEISTSRVYRSNRFFFTISHYFPKKLGRSNSN